MSSDRSTITTHLAFGMARAMDVYALTHYDPAIDAPTRVVGFVAVDDTAGTAHLTISPGEPDGLWHQRAAWAMRTTSERTGTISSRIDAEAARAILADVNGVTLGYAQIPVPDGSTRPHDAAEALLDELILMGV